ncbi:MAG: Ig-like domain-containing protein [Firmicutes bacterium]|nr:Ig-like domain-containing protein [Bacillota bacterium]
MLFGLLLAVAQIGFLPQGEVYAAVGEETSVLAFTSDVHNNENNNTGKTRLGTWIDNIKSQYGKIDAMAFGGDMAQYNSADDKFWRETQSTMDVVDGKGVTAYYTTGNHEYAHPNDDSSNFTPDKNDVTAKYIQNDWAVSDNDHNYRIYCMGVGEADTSYSYVNNAYTANQVTTLQSKLAAVDNTKPIFIITHFPLHYTAQNTSSNSRAITRASDVIDVLNNAATNGTPNDTSDDKKIVFIWGHNHSMNSPADTHYDTIYQKGYSLQYDSTSSHTKVVQFLYAAAGAMCDSEKDSGSAKVEGKGLVATVNSKGQIALAYHKADGTTVTKNGGPYSEQDPVAVTGITIDEADEAAQDGLSVEAGKKLQLHATVTPADATENTVGWISSNTAVATVDNSGKVTSVGEGQAIVTAQIADSISGGTFTASVVVNVTPRTSSGTPYVLTNTLTPGKNYLIVNANSGNAYALMNNNGTVSKEAVTIDGDTIYTDNEDIVFKAQGSGTTVDDLHNGTRYLKAHSVGLELLDVAGTTRPWEYDSSSHKLTNYKMNGETAGTHYYVFYENNAFGADTKTTATHTVYLFEETRPDVTYNVTFKVANGKWDDNTSADKTVQVTGPEGSVTLSADQIPAVGGKPDSGYKAGSWNVTPDTTTTLTGDVTYTYTYQERGNEKAYVLTNTLTPGRNYIITDTNSGSANALMNSNGTVSKATVTIDGDTIYTDNENIVFEAQGSGTTINNLHNGNRYLRGSSSLTLNTSAGGSRPWSYDGSTHKLSNKSSSSTYYVYYTNNNFTSSTSTTSTHIVYLFEEVLPDVSYDVTFKVANGKWDDNTSTDKTVQVTGPEGSVTLSADQIPAVGSKPNSGYKEGSWNATLDTSTVITGNVTYTYTYEEQGSEKAYVLTNELKAGKKYIISSANSGTAHVLTSSSTTAAEVTIDGDTIYTDDTSMVFTMGGEGGAVNYIGNTAGYVEHTSDNYLTFVSTPPSGITWTYDGSYLTYRDGGNTYYLYYKSGTNYNRYRIKSQSSAADEQLIYLFEEVSTDISCNVTFQVENGKWNDDTAEEKTVTLTGPAGTELRLSEDQIPAVGGIPGTHYKAGTWDNIPDTTTAITEDTTFKYTYEYVDHVWDGGVVTTVPTCTGEGVRTFACSVGGETRTEAIPVTGHDWEEVFTVDADPTCTEPGSKSKHCSVCDAINEETVTEIPAAGHSFGEWTEVTPSTCEGSGSEQRECSVCKTIETRALDPTGHSWMDDYTVDQEATCDADGSKSIHCSKCDAKKDSQVIPALGHDYGAWTKLDDDQHQRVCSRDESHIEKENHVWNEGAVTTQPTCTEEGETTYTCTVCGATKTEPIEALGHDYHELEGTAAAPTCTEEGKKANEKCSRCQDVKIGAKIDALGHNMTEHAAVDATCSAAGNSKYYSCDRCEKYFSDEAGETEIALSDTVIPIDENAHSWGEISYTWNGDNSRVTALRQCGNNPAHIETETADTTSAVGTPATCTAKGKTKYTATFENEAFETQNKVVENIEALGHDWGEAEYTWNDDNTKVTAKHTCKREGCNEEETETVDATFEVTKAATCTAKGETTYTSAAFTNTAFAAQTKTLENVDPLGHEWGSATYTWNEDNSQVTARRTCGRDGCSEEETETANATSAVTTPPTCTAMGKTTYTSAAFTNAAFSVQTKTLEDVAPAGHAWGSATYTWNGDNSKVTAKRECGREGCSEEETETVDVTSEVTTPPTCTVKGETTYTSAAFTNTGFAVQTKTVDNIDALGHNLTAHAASAATCTGAGNSAYWSCGRCGKYFSDAEGTSEVEENIWVINPLGHEWGEAEYTWNDNNTEVTAKRKCGRDGCDEEETETVDVTSEVTTQPTCTAKGKTTYTSKAFTNGAFEVQTKTLEDINAKGHSWGEATYTWNDDNSKVTAKRECARQGCSEEETETVDVTSEVTTQPTCTAKGKTTYTSKAFTNEAFSAQTKTLEDVNAKGHSWGETTYTWSDDNSKVTAKRECGRAGCNEDETETADVTSEVTTPPTCTAKGKTTYTSKAFTNGAFSVQTKTLEDVDALGHSYGSWTKLNYTQHQRVCAHDKTHVIIANHTWDNGRVTKEATATSQGVKTYRCTTCGFERVEAIPVLETAAAGPVEIVDLPAVKVKKPKAGKKSATVKWKKIKKKTKKKIQGIEVQYSTDGFATIAGTKTVKKSKKSVKLKGLQSKTKYQVRVRTFRYAPEGKHVSVWKVKTVKVK